MALVKNQTFLIELDPSQSGELLSLLRAGKTLLEEKNNAIPIPENSPKILTPEKTYELLGITGPTGTEWDKKGLLKPHFMGKRKFYLLDEIIESLKNQKVQRKVRRNKPQIPKN
jgi:hypothetical protein